MVRFSLHLRSRPSFEKSVMVAVSLALLSFGVGLHGVCSFSREIDPKTEQRVMDTSGFLPVSFHTQSDPWYGEVYLLHQRVYFTIARLTQRVPAYFVHQTSFRGEPHVFVFLTSASDCREPLHIRMSWGAFPFWYYCQCCFDPPYPLCWCLEASLLGILVTTQLNWSHLERNQLILQMDMPWMYRAPPALAGEIEAEEWFGLSVFCNGVNPRNPSNECQCISLPYWNSVI